MGENTVASRLLDVMEDDILPMTERSVAAGNKVFGAALLRKSDMSVVIAGTNSETDNPLLHGEISTLNQFYEMPDRPSTRDLVFLSTHEPCPLCLSAITWAGFDTFYYFFSYEDSRDAFDIPHDLRILKEVFGVEDGRIPGKQRVLDLAFDPRSGQRRTRAAAGGTTAAGATDPCSLRGAVRPISTVQGRQRHSVQLTIAELSDVMTKRFVSTRTGRFLDATAREISVGVTSRRSIR